MPDLSPDEKSRLFMTMDELVKINRLQNEKMEIHGEQLDRFDQALFGDTRLKLPGIVVDVETIKKWIMEHKLRTMFISGIFTASGFAIKAAWEWITRK